MKKIVNLCMCPESLDYCTYYRLLNGNYMLVKSIIGKFDSEFEEVRDHYDLSSKIMHIIRHKLQYNIDRIIILIRQNINTGITL